MPLLPTRLASALAAQRARSRLGERRVRQRWLRRVLAAAPQLRRSSATSARSCDTTTRSSAFSAASSS
jgi:hypothetical protein